MSEPSIAIVGMACRYPDARSPRELWENSLAQRRAFRRIPPERLRLEDYWSDDRNAPDTVYSSQAALIEGYEFDRLAYRIAGSTFRSADLAHWLALDVAAQALSDAGHTDGEGLPRDTTGVLVGNTLTGEFSRASSLRLRWPFVRRVVETALAEEGWPQERRGEFLSSLERRYKAPFAVPDEETLAGGLSNTIAGRICNHFDLKGGGHTVDGACASSLLAVTTACSALAAGDLDVSIAGGVDLSLDPFELVGFSRAGALAPHEMRVYDARSEGFWPGEGCGFVVLMRHADAVTRGHRIYAVIRGWGVASDGSGGITRPEAKGQALALARAYRRARCGADTVAYFEGHGTGTSVGDAVELQVIARARHESAAGCPAASVGSIKANIGHTKAAAGAAGLIRAVMSVHTQVVPPIPGTHEPHAALGAGPAMLRVPQRAEPWPADRPLRAAVSAMGFGGIDTHVVIESLTRERKHSLTEEEDALADTPQDAELFLVRAPHADALRRQIGLLRSYAGRLSLAELTDLAVRLERDLVGGELRAAVVASTPSELEARLNLLDAWLADGVSSRLSPGDGVYLGDARSAPRIGFLFPGQGSPSHVDGGIWCRRFASARALHARVIRPVGADTRSTEIAQPAIVINSLVALRVLGELGLRASVAIGHSLGELTSYHWAGAYDEEALVRIASARGRAMAELGKTNGAMASLAVGAREAEALIAGLPVVIAGLNAACQTVISGEAEAVAGVVTRARNASIAAVRLPVSHAFHSPLVAAAAPALRARLEHENFRRLGGRVLSTVSGAEIEASADLSELLCRQVTHPVRFAEAAAAARDEVDLWIEVGPGAVLSSLMVDAGAAPSIALDAGGESLVGLLGTAGAAFALGAPLNHAVLFAGRFARPFDLDYRPKFFTNPCEQVPALSSPAPSRSHVPGESGGPAVDVHPADDTGTQTLPALDLVRELVAEQVELPITAVRADHRLLADLHLNSILVGQLAANAARRLGLPPPVDPTAFSGATVGGLAETLEELAYARRSSGVEGRAIPDGVGLWTRAFTIRLIERPLPVRPRPVEPSEWRVIASPGHPLAVSLDRGFRERGAGRGVALCLPVDPDERHIGILLEAAHQVIAVRDARFVVVQQGGGGGAFARTVHLESPGITTCVIDLPLAHRDAADWVVDEAIAATGFTEVHYDQEGTRRESRLSLLSDTPRVPHLPLGPADVLLVTGGGKGIASECALALARDCGVRLALLGRASPDSDRVLATNLARFAAAGVEYHYLSADVSDASAVRAAVQNVETNLGAITAVLHAAGANEPRPLSASTEESIRHALAAKLGGARNLVSAIDPARLRLWMAFGSIIARTGLRGEADYGLANDWLRMFVERFQTSHPTCRCLVLEWSVWSGTGMGERLGRVEALAREGIMPIPIEAGASMLRRLISSPPTTTSVIVSGRIGQPPTLTVDEPELPLRRFLEHPRVHYPGVELVADSDLSTDTDPYLLDHAFRGKLLLPAVIGLEAMAQIAMAAVGVCDPPVFERVGFRRPVVVPEGESRTIRLAALVSEPGRVDVALRSAETEFHVNHFQAHCRFEPSVGQPFRAHTRFTNHERLDLDPARDLYGRILFQAGRFRRVRGYRLLRATECIAEIGNRDGPGDWFGDYLPTHLVLGDPGVRDAAIHAIQACIPHATLLPESVERIEPGILTGDGPWTVHARERSRDGERFTWDLEIAGADGRLRERWQGLRLIAMEGSRMQGPRPWPLLGPYLERRLGELVPGSSVHVSLHENGDAERSERSDRAIRSALGHDVRVTRRTDGKPEILSEPDVTVSSAHAGPLTLGIAGAGPLGCDVESVTPRSPLEWQQLLGSTSFDLAARVSQETEEGLDEAATRVWAARECLKKAVAAVAAPLVVVSASPDRWVLLSSGPLAIATYVGTTDSARDPMAVALLVGMNHAVL